MVRAGYGPAHERNRLYVRCHFTEVNVRLNPVSEYNGVTLNPLQLTESKDPATLLHEITFIVSPIAG